MKKRAKTPAIRGREEGEPKVPHPDSDWYSRLPRRAEPTRAQRIEIAARMALAAMDPKLRAMPMFAALRASLDLPVDDVFADQEPEPLDGFYLNSLDLEFPPSDRTHAVRTIHLPDTVIVNTVIVKSEHPLTVKISARKIR